MLKILRLVVTLTLLILLWQAIDGPAALALLLQADAGWLVMAVVALSGQTLLSALRWRVTARALGHPIPLWRAVREYYLSQIVNQSLPGGVLGDAGRAVRARHGVGLKRAGQAVVFERLAGQLVLGAVTVTAVLLVWAIPLGVTLPDWVLRFVALSVLVLVVMAGVIWGLGRGKSAAGRHVRDWTDAFALSVLAPPVLPRQALLSLGTTALNLLAFALCARATGTVMPVMAVMIVVPLILFTMLIPISISGWGLREGAAAALFPVFGATSTEGFAASLAFGLMFLLSTLPGIAVLLFQPRARPAETGSVSG
ncbi:MAG: flippase-like domain-containing protein [Rhodobacterales bacterium]|nr:flippase-like domain-containing protein [Rhodobacterales bacterium]MDX5413221.1 flippase-like domain-containing protein [Rhodobacterales bacterium]